MDQTEELLDLALRLGQALAAHERFRRLRRAEAAGRASEEARHLSEELNEQMAKVADLEQAMRPVEPQDKRRLEDLRRRVHANALLQDLARA